MNYFNPIGTAACVLLAISAALVVAGWKCRGRKPPAAGAIIAALAPGLVCCGLFWSLAAHMHLQLGGWPLGIGYPELKGIDSLIRHAELALAFSHYCIAGVLVMILPCLVAVMFHRWRRLTIHFGLCAAGISIATLLMFVAPIGFQNWWWD